RTTAPRDAGVGLLGLGRGLAPGEGSGLALAGAGRLAELAAALVLGLRVAEASLEGLAAGTGRQEGNGGTRTPEDTNVTGSSDKETGAGRSNHQFAGGEIA